MTLINLKQIRVSSTKPVPFRAKTKDFEAQMSTSKVDALLPLRWLSCETGLTHAQEINIDWQIDNKR